MITQEGNVRLSILTTFCYFASRGRFSGSRERRQGPLGVNVLRPPPALWSWGCGAEPGHLHLPSTPRLRGLREPQPRGVLTWGKEGPRHRGGIEFGHLHSAVRPLRTHCKALTMSRLSFGGCAVFQGQAAQSPPPWAETPPARAGFSQCTEGAPGTQRGRYQGTCGSRRVLRRTHEKCADGASAKPRLQRLPGSLPAARVPA